MSGAGCGTHLASIDGVVELVLKITTRRKGIPVMVQALATLMGQARLQRGCVDCRLYAEIGHPRSLCYQEQWSTLRDLESQLRSERFGMLLAIMETAPEAPHLELRTVSEQRGLEYVRTIRLASPGIACATGGPAAAVSDRLAQPTDPGGLNPQTHTTRHEAPLPTIRSKGRTAS